MNRKIIEYHLATGGTQRELNVAVNDAIKVGFQPFGSANVFFDKESYYTQAMVMYKE